MTKFVDLHNHMAYGIDDGLQSKEETIQGLKALVKENIDTIVLTPHVKSSTELSVLKERMKEVKELGKYYGINVLEGSEVLLNQSMMDTLDKVVPIENTKVVLVEFDLSLGRPKDESMDYLHELKVLGYIPMIAHIERYFEKVNYELIDEWLAMGCILQVNRTSIIGLHGSTVQKRTLELITKGVVHVVASDTHSLSGRKCRLQDSYDVVRKKLSKEIADEIHINNPIRIINNEEVHRIEYKKKKFLGLF